MIISHHDVGIAQLDDEIAQTQTTLNNLVSKRQSTLWIRDAHAALLSPMQRMPPEILAEIFTNCLPCDRHGKISTQSAPLLLMAVCRRWNAVALSLPKLWATISVTLYANSFSPKRSLLEAWITRSRSCPLTLNLNHDEIKTCCTFSKTVEPVFTIFVQHLHRLRHFHLRLPLVDTNAIPSPFQNPHVRSCSILETVHMSAPSLPAREMEWLCSFLFPAPELRHVYWRSHQYISGLPLSQLTTLDLDPGTVAPWVNFREVFGRACRVTSLRLRSVSIQTMLGTPILLPALRLLTLPCDTELGALFDSVILPSLKELIIHPERGRTYSFPFWPHARFKSLLARSSCSITSLTLYNTCITSEHLIEYLRTMQDLLKLEIINEAKLSSVVGEEVLGLLTPDPARPLLGDPICLAPKLQCVKLWKCISAADGLLADMVESRWRMQPIDGVVPVTRLQRFTGTVRKSIHPEDLRRIREFHMEGLRAVLHKVKGKNE
jgi:hypothetical protein